MGIVVTLDPGHVAGYNTGINRNYREGTVMFTLAYKLKNELEKYNDIKVYVTRTALNQNPTLSRRGQIGIANDSDVFLSLHSNAAGASAMGSVMYRSVKRPNSTDLGEAILNAVVATMKADVPKTYSRGVLTRPNSSGGDYYGVIRSSVAGSSPVKYTYIIEHGFHTNSAECAWLMKDSNISKLAVAEAKAIADYFGLSKTTTNVNKEQEEKEMNELKQAVDALRKEVADLKKMIIDRDVVYSTLEDTPEWYAEAISKGMKNGAIMGTGNGEINVSEDLARTLTILDRLGFLDKNEDEAEATE